MFCIFSELQILRQSNFLNRDFIILVFKWCVTNSEPLAVDCISGVSSRDIRDLKVICFQANLLCLHYLLFVIIVNFINQLIRYLPLKFDHPVCLLWAFVCYHFANIMITAWRLIQSIDCLIIISQIYTRGDPVRVLLLIFDMVKTHGLFVSFSLHFIKEFHESLWYVFDSMCIQILLSAVLTLLILNVVV